MPTVLSKISSDNEEWTETPFIWLAWGENMETWLWRSNTSHPKTVHNFQSHFNYLVNRKYTGMIDEGISVLYCKQASLKTKLLSGTSNGLLMAHVWSISFHMCEPFRSFDKPLKTSVFNWFKNSTYFWHYDQARYPLPFIVQFSTKTKLTGMQ